MSAALHILPVRSASTTGYAFAELVVITMHQMKIAMHQMNCVAAAAASGKPMMENPAKHLVYRPTAMQLLSILTTTMEVMPKVSRDRPARMSML
jgi:hypothetical protein